MKKTGQGTFDIISSVALLLLKEALNSPQNIILRSLDQNYTFAQTPYYQKLIFEGKQVESCKNGPGRHVIELHIKNKITRSQTWSSTHAALPGFNSIQ